MPPSAGLAIHWAVSGIPNPGDRSMRARLARDRGPMPRRLDPDPSLPIIISPAAARAAGLSINQVRYRLDAKRWSRVTWGAYRSSLSLPDNLDAFARARVDHGHRALACAVRNPGSVIGFESAAILIGLPLVSPVPDLVTLIVPPGHWSGVRSGIRFRTGIVSGRDRAEGSLRVTGVDRTWLDLARTAPLADALAVGDWASAMGLLDVSRMRHDVDAIAGLRGCRRAMRALDLVDGRRESPLESASYAYFAEMRIPLPDCQVVLSAPSGQFLARVDFWWAHARLIGECDGRSKYRTPADLYDEKRREDGLREMGYGVMRWGMSDLRGRALAERLRRRLQS